MFESLRKKPTDIPELSCKQGNCDHLVNIDDSSFEQSFETLDEIFDQIDICYGAIRTAVGDIHSSEEDWLAEKGGEAVNRRSRRRLAKSNTAKFTELRQREQNRIDDTLELVIGHGWDAYPAIETDVAKLKEFSKVISMLINGKPFEVISGLIAEDQDVHLSCQAATLAELRARTHLAIFQNQNPSLADNLYCPDYLKELPYSFQRIVAADIHKGEKCSVVLQHLQRQMDNDSSQPTPHDILCLLNPNGLSRNTKSFFQTVGTVAIALGSCGCPSNGFGICRRVLDRVPIPEDVMKELKNKQESHKRNEITRLKLFATNLGNDPLKTHVKSRGCGSESAPKTIKRHKGVDTKPESIEVSPEKISEMPFSKITVLIDGHTIQLDPKDEASISEGLRLILGTDIIDRYISKHNTHGIREFFENAINTILLTPSHSSEISIVRVASAPKIHSNGRTACIYRLSGKKLSSAGAGLIGKRTRIFFGSITKGDERTVVISYVSHKNQTEKHEIERGLAHTIVTNVANQLRILPPL